MRSPLQPAHPLFNVRVNESPTHATLAVTFEVSMRQLLSDHHSAMAHDIITRAAQAMSHTLAEYLNSVDFEQEMRSTVREELKLQVKKALIDRVDDLVEDMLT